MEDPQEGFDLDWREACALLGCSQSHFYNLVNAGGIPAVRNGRRKGSGSGARTACVT